MRREVVCGDAETKDIGGGGEETRRDEERTEVGRRSLKIPWRRQQRVCTDGRVTEFIREREREREVG